MFEHQSVVNDFLESLGLDQRIEADIDEDVTIQIEDRFSFSLSFDPGSEETIFRLYFNDTPKQAFVLTELLLQNNGHRISDSYLSFGIEAEEDSAYAELRFSEDRLTLDDLKIAFASLLEVGVWYESLGKSGPGSEFPTGDFIKI